MPRLAATATDRFGRIDALVNCAALDAVFGGLEEADWDSWRQAIEINLFGTMQMTQAVIPAMKEQGGSVVFIGSQAMFWSQLPQAAYGASKAAILGAVTHLAASSARTGSASTPSCRRGCGGRRSRCTST